MSTGRKKEDGASLTPADLVRVLRRRVVWIAACAGFAAAAALGLALQRQPKFEASATVMLDASSMGGLLGNLAMLSPIGGGIAATSELAVLRSRAVVTPTVRPPAEDAAPAPEDPAYALGVGLTTIVTDESQTLWTLIQRQRKGAVDGRPPVQPAHRLFAHARVTTAEAPRSVRVRFLDEARVRVELAGLFQTLGLAATEPEELAFTAGEPLDYRGLRLWLAPRGDVQGRDFALEAVPEYEATERLMERFWAAETTRNSGVIRLTVEDTDPYRAAETANALAENYLVQQHSRGRTRSDVTIRYIEGLLDDSRTAMEQAQKELLEARTERPETISVDASAQALIDQISQLQIRETTLSLKAKALREVLADLERGNTLALARLDGAMSGGLVVDPITEGYLERLASLNARFVDLSQVYEPEHPRLTEVQGSAEEVLALIQAQLRGRLTGLDFQLEEAATARGEYLGQLGLLPGDMLALAEPSLVLQTQKELIPELLRNLKATEIADAGSSLSSQILDRAVPATRVASPRPVAVIAVGGVLGLLLGLFFALLREPATARVRGRDDLEQALLQPVVGVVPLQRRATPGDMESAPRTVDAIRSLRAAVKNLRAGEAGRVRVLGVTSVPSSGARANMTAALARSFAREGARVALVETDLRERRLSGLLGLNEAPGLAEALDAGAAADEEPRGVHAAAEGDLVMVPAGRPDQGARDLLSGARFDQLLERLSAERDLVLLDLPAAGASSDVESIAPKLDGLLIACETGGARLASLSEARDSIERAGGRVLGAVLLTPYRRGARP
ncbi:MAG: Wzz/FepE/Etk N-terminal domain-containing protein [Planctomycetota bacterium]